MTSLCSIGLRLCSRNTISTTLSRRLYPACVSTPITRSFHQLFADHSPQALYNLSRPYTTTGTTVAATDTPTPSIVSTETVVATETDSDERLFSSVMLKVRGSDEAVLKSYVQFILRATKVLEIDCSGAVVLPMHINKLTVNKSPHIFRLHRHQYEQRTHARAVHIRNVTGATSDVFLEYIQRMKPEGVSMSVEATELNEIPDFLME